MNIGIDIRPLMTAPRTGVGEYTYELLNAIFNIDRENRYFLFYNSGKDVSANIPDWKFENVKIIGSHISNKFFNSSLSLLGLPKLDRMCGRTKIDAWFAPNLNFSALSSGTNFILTIHDLSFEFFPEFSTLKQRLWHKAVRPKKQCERADLIITPSENTKRDIIDYYKVSPEKIKVIYPGINTADYNQNIKIKYNLPDRFILFLGTIEPRKNIIGLIDAFEIFCIKSNSHKLVIAGAPGWKNEEIIARAKKSKFSDKIKLIGFVDPKDKPALYQAADVFVYPSLYEGFGFPVLEAMNAGVPVITSNRSSLTEVAGSAGYLTDPTRPEQIATAISELTGKPILRDWHIQKGREQAKKFVWENTAREWLNTIKTL